MKSGASEIVQMLNTPVTKLDDLTLIPGSHMAEGETNPTDAEDQISEPKLLASTSA